MQRERGVKDETGSSNGKSSGRKLPASIAGNKGRSGANKTSSSSSNATSSKGTLAQQGQGQGMLSLPYIGVYFRQFTSCCSFAISSRHSRIGVTNTAWICFPSLVTGKRSIGRLAVSQRNDNEVIDIE
jgi:hypothetical protein